MSDWDTFPEDYRAGEIEIILQAIRAGESVSVIGLSGAGKSNLLGYLQHRAKGFDSEFVLADCNRLLDTTPAAFWHLIATAMGSSPDEEIDLERLAGLISERLDASRGSVCVMFDRFDVLTNPPQPTLYSNLRVLRDSYKYRLTFVVATRTPLDSTTELAELFYAHTLWLGPLSDSDARWNIRRYASRIGAEWDPAIIEVLLQVSGKYPSLLRAVCEAHAAGAAPDLTALSAHPAVQRRVAEFWLDSPDRLALEASGLTGLPLLQIGKAPQFDTASFTAKEERLFAYLQAHAGQVCAKDDIIQAVWPEDQIYEAGVRDDSLAQLVRRLRVKIEADPANPHFIQTVPGRGYQFTPAEKLGKLS